MFNLDECKEIMPYDYYNEKLYTENNGIISQAIKFIGNHTK